jgi:hypothetical protein
MILLAPALLLLPSPPVIGGVYSGMLPPAVLVLYTKIHITSEKDVTGEG